MPPKCELCQTYHSQKKPCPTDPAQSAPSAEPEELWDSLTKENPTWFYSVHSNPAIAYKDVATKFAKRYAALRTAQLREKTIQECVKIAEAVERKERTIFAMKSATYSESNIQEQTLKEPDSKSQTSSKEPNQKSVKGK